MRIYLSHSDKSKDAIKQVVLQIRDRLRLAGLFHEVDLYVPAEHDDFVDAARSSRFLTEEEIDDVGCFIIKHTCEGVLVYCPEDDPFDSGRKTAFDWARKLGILTCRFEHIGEAVEFIKYVHKGRDK